MTFTPSTSIHSHLIRGKITISIIYYCVTQMIQFVCLIFKNYLLNPLSFFFFFFFNIWSCFLFPSPLPGITFSFSTKTLSFVWIEFILNLGIPDVNITLSPTSHILAKICKAHSKCLEPIHLKPLFCFLFFVLLLRLLLLLLLATPPTILSIMVP